MTTVMQTLAACRQQLTAPGAPFELAQIEHGGGTMAVYRHAQHTLAGYIDSGRVHGAKEFLAYEGDRWSFDRFYAAVDALASQLHRRLGVRAGDRVAIAMRNRPEWAVAFAAAASLGAVPAPLNSFGLRDELLAGLRNVEPKVVLLDAERLARIEADLVELPCAVVLADAEPAAGSPVLALSDLLAAGPGERPSLEIGPDDPALLLFTSGATSQAKAVLSSQRAVCQALHNIDYIGAISALTSPRIVAGIVERGFAPAMLTAVPLFHVSGLHAQLLFALRSGRRMVLMHRWDVDRAFELIRDEGITQFSGAPSMVMQLLRDARFDDPAHTRSLGGIGFGGAGLPQRLIDELLERRPDAMAGIGFGLTETNGVACAASGELFRCQPRSAGVQSPIAELRVADLDGSPLPPGREGELWLRGVTVMDSYWHNPQATAQAFVDGWFCSGDIGYVDDDGFVFVVDRIKDVINRNGEKIAAAEVESCLLQHAGIAEAAVIAQPDALTGEAVVAVVVAEPGAVLDEAGVRAHVAARLASYKVPAVVHVRHQELPRNPAGKMLKAALKREYVAQ